jgi:hypothetical protein
MGSLRGWSVTEHIVQQDISGSPEAQAARERVDEWDRSLAAELAALPIPRPSYGAWVVLAPGSRRRHMLATVGEVVGMLTPTWEITEERWVAVRTVCGRPGPFGSAGLGEPRRQDCGACWRSDANPWEGFDQHQPSHRRRD